MNKETKKLFSTVSFFAFFVTFVLSVMNNAFIPSCMLMLSLFLFSVCYIINSDKKVLIYTLFGIGILLIFGSIIYTYVRIF